MFPIEKYNLSDSSFRKCNKFSTNARKWNNKIWKWCKPEPINDIKLQKYQKNTQNPTIYLISLCYCVSFEYHCFLLFEELKMIKIWVEFSLIYLKFFRAGFFENLGGCFWWPEGFILEILEFHNGFIFFN